MKQQFINALQEGDRVNDYFVVTRKDLRTQQNGGKFLGMVFRDRTGEIGGILWQNAAAIARQFETGDVVSVRGTVTSYQDRLQIRVDQVLPLREEEYDRDDLVYKAEDAEAMLQKLVEKLNTVQDAWLSQLLHRFLDDKNFMDAFSRAAAGKRWHHAFQGGLTRHCYEMICLAETVCSLFPKLNRDLLLAAIFFHDLGKLEEMSHDMCIDYTTKGKLIGHITLGTMLLERHIAAIPGFPDSLRLELLHCIVAHHGEMENGSPITPRTLEALMLYHIDNLDAQADAFIRVINETRERGEEWSSYINQIDRQIWAGGE